jgi:hypothetical protein
VTARSAAEALVVPLLPHLGAAVRKHPRPATCAVLVATAARAAALEGLRPRVLDDGRALVAVAAEELRALVDAHSVGQEDLLGAPLAEGQTWCLALTDDGAVLAPIAWPATSATRAAMRVARS